MMEHDQSPGQVGDALDREDGEVKHGESGKFNFGVTLARG